MSFPKCQVPTRKQWSTERDKKKGKDGLSKQSMGKSLDKFHAAIETAEKNNDVAGALSACDTLGKVFKAYLADVEKLGKYEELVKYFKIGPKVLLEQYVVGLENLAEGEKDYTQDIEAAKEIAEQWKRAAASALVKLRNKKSEIDEIDDWWERVGVAINKGHISEPNVLEEFQTRVGFELKKLPKLEQEATKIFEEFNTWALNGPRKGFETINKQLNLGDVNRNRGIAVAKACKSLLSEVSGAFGAMDDLWLTETKPLLESLQHQGAGYLKVLAGEVDHLETERQRVVKGLEQFNGVVTKIFMSNLKVQSDATLYAELLKLNELDSVMRPKLEGRPALLRKRQASLPQFAQLLDKQVKAVKKNLPEALEKSGPVQDLDEAFAQASGRLKQTDVLYTRMLEKLTKLGVAE